MKVTTRNYKATPQHGKWDWRMTGIISTNYHKVGGTYYGVKALVFITNCPNRYWSRKAANYILKNKVTMYGWSQHKFDNTYCDDMPKTELIQFSDIAFGAGYPILDKDGRIIVGVN